MRTTTTTVILMTFASAIGFLCGAVREHVLHARRDAQREQLARQHPNPWLNVERDEKGPHLVNFMRVDFTAQAQTNDGRMNFQLQESDDGVHWRNANVVHIMAKEGRPQ